MRTGLRAVVWDEGLGGAQETVTGGGGEGGGGGPSGLLGIRRRVAALDGVFTVTSPVGGPTMVAVELPYVW
ncbi:hypothetical protein ACFU53_28350 [Streptomyces sp. NPDC057474]|uniref:hypothetical protein n=1 Tax=Streptomyces sp. NPDC057474 TaxID=3346144 RepID=UPI0036B57539